MIWQPYVRSNGEWIATKILQGIFGAPIESLAEITVSDVVRVTSDIRRPIRHADEVVTVLYA
jgi:hypothetical protein